MTKDPARFWWMKLVLVGICLIGVWSFEHILFPESSGWIGGTIGLVLGAFMATVYEDYMDQNSG